MLHQKHKRKKQTQKQLTLAKTTWLNEWTSWLYIEHFLLFVYNLNYAVHSSVPFIRSIWIFSQGSLNTLRNQHVSQKCLITNFVYSGPCNAPMFF